MSSEFIQLGSLHRIRVSELPRCDYMTAGQYVTHVMGPALGYTPDADGHLRMLIVIMASGNQRSIAFGPQDRHRPIRDVVPEGARLNIVLNIGGPESSRNFAYGDNTFPNYP
jgi:hypothetical protein